MGPYRVGTLAGALLLGCFVMSGAAASEKKTPKKTEHKTEGGAVSNKEEGREAAIVVQGVLASKGTDAKNPEIAESLKAYRELLKRFRFGKYDDIGRDSGKAATGGQIALKIGSYTIDITVVAVKGGSVKISYTVKDNAGKDVGKSSATIGAGEVVPIQLGDPEVPVILLFKAN